ncbi:MULTISPECIES: winged helix-turn-helix domain-containing protein [Methanosarcina]|uniref:winged helix-turn-helix domain-containing protein n=1 Tax=Methanosarcina TaxID=2207 RepID=UPI001E284DB7|nr:MULTISPECIES: winged helix-turn-helix domain-containing protein [Methanosarcina]
MTLYIELKLLYRKENDKDLESLLPTKRYALIFLKCNYLQRLFINYRGGVSIKRRSRTDIAVDILRVAMNGAKKTHIVYEVNLNFNIAQKYLEMLKEKELIRHENGLFITTDKGKVFQEMAKELKL